MNEETLVAGAIVEDESHDEVAGILVPGTQGDEVALTGNYLYLQPCL
jgi:hypothetical protein